ncbi:MAG: rhomboid family intramembrane serine protease [Sandaracinaceae bacterium]
MIRPDKPAPPGWGPPPASGSPRPPAQARVEPAAPPTPWLTYILIAVNVLVFAAMGTSGVSLTDPEGWDLIRCGSNFGPYTLNGQPWRLLTAAFLHGGILHIAMNMYVLHQAGRGAELRFGRLAYAEIYLLAAIGGSAASVLYNPDVNSVGASGAVFGVVGAHLAHVLRNYKFIRKDARPGVLRSLGIFFAINAAIGFMVPQIDSAAHVGGLIAGFVGALPLVRSIGPGSTRLAGWRYAVAPVLTVVLVLLVVVVGMTLG